MTKQAIDKAAALASAFNSELRLVNVQTLIPIAFLDYVKGNFDQDIRQGLEKEIAALAASIDHPTGRISTVVLFGPVYQKVLGGAGNPPTDPRYEPGQSTVGRSEDPWRTAQTWDRRGPNVGRQIYGEAQETSLARLEDVPPQSCRWDRIN